MATPSRRGTGVSAAKKPATLRLQPLEDRTVPAAIGTAEVDVAAGMFTPEQLAAFEIPVPVPNLSTKTPPAGIPDGGHEDDPLTIVLDFKKPGQANTTDIFGDVVSTFNIGAYGFAASQFDALCQAMLAEVRDDYFNELAGTVAGPAGKDLAINFVLGDIGTPPPGITEYYYVQIGTGVSGPNIASLGVAGLGVVRDETGFGPNFVEVGDVVGSIYTNNILTLGDLTPSDALTSGNIGFTTFAVGGTLSHEIGHALSLSHINKLDSVQPTPGRSPIMGTGAIDLPNPDRITDREFSLSGFDGQDNDAPREHVQQLADAVGVHDFPNAAPVNTLPGGFSTPVNTAIRLAGVSVSDPDAGSADIQVTLAVDTGKLDVATDIVDGVELLQVTGNGTDNVVITAPVAAINATLAAVTGLVFTPEADFSGGVALTMTSNDLGNSGEGGAMTATSNSVIAVVKAEARVIVEILPLNPKPAAILGTTVGSLAANFDAVDLVGVKGIAITGKPASTTTGTWEFSVNGGGAWTPVPTVAEDGALLLSDSPDNRVRFNPAKNFTGFAPAVSFKAWDLTGGNSGDTGVDTTVGAGFSDRVQTASAGVGKTVPAVDFQGNPQLTSVLKNNPNPAGDMVKALLGFLAADTDKKNVLGIAVTALHNGDGQWQWQSAGKWADITDVSNAKALLLGPTTKIRFLPDAGFTGTATLLYHVWDQSVGKVGETADVAGSAFSAASELAEVNVVTKPVLSVTRAASLTPPATVVVASLLAGAVSEVEDNAVGLAVTGLSGKGTWSYRIGAGAAVPITAVTIASALLLPGDAVLSFAPAATGFAGASLSYKAWNTQTFIGRAGDKANASGPAFSAATETLAVAGPGDGNVRPVIGKTAVSLGKITEDPTLNPGVTVKSIVTAAKITDGDKTDKKGIALASAPALNGTWQYSFDGLAWVNVGAVSQTLSLLLPDTAKIRFVPNANFFGNVSVDFKAWDGTVGSPGDYLDSTVGTAFNDGNLGEATLEVTSVNDSPVLDTTGVHFLEAIDPGATSETILVSNLILDTTDVETPADIGLAISAVTGPGKWKFSIDGGSTFTNVTKFPTLLQPTDVLQFVGDPGKKGLAVLTYQAWDTSTGEAPSTLKPDALSKGKEILTVEVGNESPELSGEGKLTGIKEDPATNPGDTVAKILGTTYSDEAVGKKGIAVTAVTSPTVGQWQFSLDAGKTWLEIPAVDDTDALLLGDTAKIRFVPAPDHFSADEVDQPTLSYRAWDQTVGSPGEIADTMESNLNAFSSTVTVKIAITGVPDAPTLDTTPLREAAADASSSVDTLITGVLTSPESTTFGIAITGLTGKGQWRYSTDDFASEGTVITGVSPASALLLPSNASLKFIPTDPAAVQVATLSYKGWDALGGGTAEQKVSTISAGNKRFFSTAIETLSVSIGNHLPTLSPL